jgi:hypothetical protein
MIRLCIALLAGTCLLAQIEAPRIGCFTGADGSFEIAGLAANFVVQPVESCIGVESPWRVIDVDGEPWLERRDALSHAVEVRWRLEAGVWAVFADGTLAQLDALHLPGLVQGWRLVARDWMLVHTEGADILLRADGQWFYLPRHAAGVEQR